ncbi:unnamed protein product [Rotaria sp. Silwood1]|nr:unnamed protein product [Rotaria sp. Silwood1]
MDDLFYCIRIMQISTDKLQSTRNIESLRRSSLIRSTFLQSRKHFCDLIHSLIKISSTTNALLPVIIENEENRTNILPYQHTITSQKCLRDCKNVERISDERRRLSILRVDCNLSVDICIIRIQ